MSFELVWTLEARARFDELAATAQRAAAKREKDPHLKTSKQEGLFRQVVKCIELVASNPRHPGLHTHSFSSIDHPYDPRQKVFEAYVQNRTPGAYRLFWCHGPGRNQITIIAITPHP